MPDEYGEMLSKINEIINELKTHNHDCEQKKCCVKLLLREIEFNE